MERLIFIAGPMQGRVVELAKPEISVGREPTSRLQLMGDRCISRRHARFVRHNGALYVEDLGSKNGTLVNGEKIVGARQVSPGDLIQMAYHQMRVEWSPAAFGPAAGSPEPAPAAVGSVNDRSWLLGLVPSLILAPLGVIFWGLSGMQLVPYVLVLTGLALACAGLIRFYRPAEATAAFERAFLQTLSGSALAILGAIWLNALR